MTVKNIFMSISCFASILFFTNEDTRVQKAKTVVSLETITSELDDVINTAMEDLKFVPGFAIAVYTPDGTYKRGFGVTDVETNAAVSADTAFYIGSTTKAFTALTMNILHHRGDLNLDTTIEEYAPEIRFAETLASDRITLRNLLTHTHGLLNEPLTFRSAFSGQHTPDINWKLLETKTIRNAEKPIGKFQYSNIGYNILTTLTNRKLKTPWQDLLQQNIFAPAGMTRTTARMSNAIAHGWSIAAPHEAGAWPKDGGFVQSVKHLTIEKTDKNMQSAGGVIMSANDAARWLEILVEDGKLEGKQILPANIIEETRKRHVKRGDRYAGYTRDHYGLGWNIGQYRENSIVSHGGDFPGYSAQISYMPELKIGITSFANESTIGRELPIIINNYIYDRLMGRENARKDAEQKIRKVVKQGKLWLESTKNLKVNRSKRQWTLSKPFEDYVGTYENETWGMFEIFLKDGKLAYRIGNVWNIAEPFPELNTMRIEPKPGDGTVAVFTLDANKNISGIKIMTADGWSWFEKNQPLLS
ncbi:serine hydrolase [Kordiimonas sp. SCSIO 12603]|uniref:serine hydrolase n=1 Tax=Kordiimonas sp. SCSIO 12603 TaxID=2829596 RepID=UPI002106EA66|nr:serine hydrolase [Kordiimonas sp. SCSIO 12603]UTW59535.1 serine hydrolase [Kordiimonas sp. SCSIO 12603]